MTNAKLIPILFEFLLERRTPCYCRHFVGFLRDFFHPICYRRQKKKKFPCPKWEGNQDWEKREIKGPFNMHALFSCYKILVNVFLWCFFFHPSKRSVQRSKIMTDFLKALLLHHFFPLQSCYPPAVRRTTDDDYFCLLVRR